MSIREIPMIRTLRDLRGNQRACVYTEPLWGIPYNLYAPYAALYMAALGVNDTGIGLLATLGPVLQVFFSLLSGVITDKLGRRFTTFLFDFAAWSVPCLIWAFAQNFAWFVAAAAFNSVWRVTSNSWTCLLVEDNEGYNLIHIFAWLNIAGQITVFIAPLAGLFISWYSLVPTMRVFYLLSCVMMSVKFIVMYVKTRETRHGAQRMSETRGVSVLKLIGESAHVFRGMLKAPRTLLTIGLMAATYAITMVNGSFWSLRVIRHMAVPETLIPAFAFVRSAIALTFFFFVTPRVSYKNARTPYVLSFAALALSMLLMLVAPAESGLIFPIIAAFLEAAALAVVSPVNDSMLAINVDPSERARIVGMVYAVMLLIASPFGFIAGVLSEVNGALPFLLNLALIAAAAVLAVMVTGRIKDEDDDTGNIKQEAGQTACE